MTRESVCTLSIQNFHAHVIYVIKKFLKFHEYETQVS